MATTEEAVTLKETIRCLEDLNFHFPESSSMVEAIRKGTFTLKTRWGLMDEDGNYRHDDPCTKILSEQETQIMMQDVITLTNGKTVSGAEYAEVTAIMCDRKWAGMYDAPVIIPDDSVI
jgi:hypothetical protein